MYGVLLYRILRKNRLMRRYFLNGRTFLAKGKNEQIHRTCPKGRFQVLSQSASGGGRIQLFTHTNPLHPEQTPPLKSPSAVKYDSFSILCSFG